MPDSKCAYGFLRCSPSSLSTLLLMAHRHAEVDEEDLSEFLNDGSWKRGYNIDRLGTTSSIELPYAFIVVED